MTGLGELFKVVAEGKKDYEEHDPKGRLQKEIRETVKEDVKVSLGDLLKELADLKKQEQRLENPPQMEEVLEELGYDQPEIIPEVIPVVEDLGSGQNDIQQYIKSKAFQQHKAVYEPPGEPADLRTVKDKIKFLEQWISRIASTGPGGGAGEVYNLDMPTTTVTGDYTLGRKDYYVGVNCDVKCYITLPSIPDNVKNGRIVVIKDESGHAQLTPIKIIGMIDNDPNGAEIRINNGAVQLLYSNGQWRII